MAPAGDEKSAYAAIDSGANAIYLGLSDFSARNSAENFSFPELEKLITYAHFFNVKIYVAMNTLIKDDELSDFIQKAVAVHNAGADAIIIQDLYLGAYLKKTYPQMCLHLSTQAGVCNAYGARYAKELGYSRVILARETAIEDIKEIAKIIETEVFVQGALCTCFSGQCYLSSFAGGNSGNRGRCKQPCRKLYSINRKGFESPSYAISLSDLHMGESVEELIDAGVYSFKIEGRMRRPEYVAAAVNYYKKLIAKQSTEEAFSDLKRTYNRGNYTKSLAFGQDKSLISSSVQGHIGEYVGTVTVVNGEYFCNGRGDFTAGDGFKILRLGKEKGGATFRRDGKGGFFLESAERLKNGDKVFITTDASLSEKLLSGKRRKDVRLSARFVVGDRPTVTLNGKLYSADFVVEEAKNRPTSAEDIKNCFDKTDLYPYNLTYENIEVGENAFVPASLLNAFRRKVYADCFDGGTKPEIIENIDPLPTCRTDGKNAKTAVIARSLNGLKSDIGVLKPNDYFADLSLLYKGFSGEKFLYLPPFLTGAEIESLKGVINAFDGIYCGGNYSVLLAGELKKKLFAGTGFNLSNRLFSDACPADYIALSKEITSAEARRLSGRNVFYLTAGDIQVMDIIYCPFEKRCKECDGRNLYALTDEGKRSFPLRRYRVSGCRFELYNCASLITANKSRAGALYDFTLQSDPVRFFNAAGDIEKLRAEFKNYTKGHSENGVS